MPQTAIANAYNALVIAQLLRQHDYHIVHSPGARNTALVRALEQACVPVTTVIDERAAAFMALGLAHAGRNTALLSTSGSACSHYLPALLEARASRCPILVLSCDRPAKLQQVRAAQTTDQVRIAKAVVDSCHHTPVLSTANVQTLFSTWQQIQHVLRQRSPAWWNIGIEEPFWPRDEPESTPEVPAQPAAGNPKEPKPVPVTMAPARTLLVCGANLDAVAELPSVAQAVQQLASTAGWPVVLDGGSCLHPCFTGHEFITYQDQMARHSMLDSVQPELVIRIGGATTSKAFEQWLAGSRQLSIAPAEICNPAAGQTDWINADSLDGLRAITQTAEAEADWAASWYRLQESATTALDSTTRSVWQWVAESTQPGSILHLANSTVIRDFELYGQPLCTRVSSIHSNRGLNGIDGQIATAVGEARGHAKVVYCVLGDVTTQHDIGSLALVQHSPVPVHLIVLNNNGGQIFRRLPGLQQFAQFEARFSTPPQWDFAHAAQAVGLQYDALHVHASDVLPANLIPQNHSSLTELILP